MPEENSKVVFTELVKLYMQQFGMLTFGTITVLVMQYVIVTPQLERSQQTAEAQQQLLQDLHVLTSDLKDLSMHQRQTAELLDRALLRVETK